MLNEGGIQAPYTNLHYDPSTYTLSVNARIGKPIPDETVYNAKGNETIGIAHVADAVNPAEHYSELNIDPPHKANDLDISANFPPKSLAISALFWVKCRAWSVLSKMSSKNGPSKACPNH